MAGTYSQVLIQVVFSVKFRERLLRKDFREHVFKYMAGIINEKGQKTIIVNGVEDHVHCLIGIKPSMAISDLVRDIKNNSSKFINDNGWVKGKFQWQEGYGVFSYSYSELERVYRYIENQEAHHAKKTFQKEYLDFLEQFYVDYKPEYVFDLIAGQKE